MAALKTIGNADITGLVKALKAGEPVPVPVLLDALDDGGHPALADYLRRMKDDFYYRGRGAALYPAHAATAVEGHMKALAAHQAIGAVDLDRVPVMSTDRRIDRKDQAKLARTLFKRLGVPHLSVTTPNYSMASTVDVDVPGRRDYGADQFNKVPHDDPARAANNNARLKVEAILLKAFPNHNDRSDSRSDYFDFCWSISVQ